MGERVRVRGKMAVNYSPLILDLPSMEEGIIGGTGFPACADAG
jgi:hypothetical protein